MKRSTRDCSARRARRRPGRAHARHLADAEAAAGDAARACQPAAAVSGRLARDARAARRRRCACWSRPRTRCRRGAIRGPRPRPASTSREARRKPGDRSVRWLHAEHRGYSNDRDYLDPQQPGGADLRESAGGRPLRLVGVMFSVPRGVRARRRAVPVHALAQPSRLRAGRPARAGAAHGRPCPPGGRAPGQRDDAPLVHARPAQRVRDPRAGARALPRAAGAPADCRRRRQPRADDVATSSPLLERLWGEATASAPARTRDSDDTRT